MSIRAINWAFHEIAYGRGADLTPSAALTLIALAHCHNQETGRCDPSLARLAEKTGLAERTVRLSLRALEKAGLLATFHRKISTHRGRRYLRNRYNLRGAARFADEGGAGFAADKEVRAPSAYDDLVMAITLPQEEATDDWRPAAPPHSQRRRSG